jgi:hypothetical protein
VTTWIFEKMEVDIKMRLEGKCFGRINRIELIMIRNNVGVLC